MGLIRGLTHLLIKTVITSFLLMILIWFFLDIEPTKVPSLMLITFVASALASLIASVLLDRSKGGF